MSIRQGLMQTARQTRRRRLEVSLRHPAKMERCLVVGLLLALVFAIYFILNLQFTGPTYLRDEIGYLTKAALLAGHVTDGASSYFAGYSLLISPAFLLFSDPFHIWKAVIFINSLLFTFSFLAIYLLLRELFPEKGFWPVILATFFCSIYPAWMTMAGYSFATPGFVLVFTLSTLIFTKVSKSRNAYLTAAFALLTGFLYWIHPVGIAVIVSAASIYLFNAIRQRRPSELIAYISIAAIMVLLYQRGVHPWMNDILTPLGSIGNDHYSELARGLSSSTSLKSWTNSTVLFLGRVAYAVISTFGIAVFTFSYLIKKISSRKDQTRAKGVRSEAVALMLLAVLVSIIFTSVVSGFNLAEGRQLRVEQWIYGRYTEMMLLPVLAVGLIVTWSRRAALRAALFIVFVGIVAGAYTGEHNTSYAFNLINGQGFWPEVLVSQVSFTRWFLVGSFGVFVAGMLGKRVALPVIAVFYLLCIQSQQVWHHSFLSGYSKPSGVVEVLREISGDGACIAFNPNVPQKSYERERLSMYTFYFYDFTPQGMSIEDWVDSDCGVYLTFESIQAEVRQERIVVVGREKSTGLYVYALVDRVPPITADRNFEDFSVNRKYPHHDECVVRGCFSKSAHELRQFIMAGSMVEDSIRTTSAEGYLFFGPYEPLDSGEYKLVIHGEFERTNGSVLEVVSSSPSETVILREELSGASDQIEVLFRLTEDSKQLEVRLFVGSDTSLSVHGYHVEIP